MAEIEQKEKFKCRMSLTEVTSASCVIESDVLVDQRLIKVFAQLSCDSLTENVEDSGSHCDA